MLADRASAKEAVAYYLALCYAAQGQPQRFENIIWTLGAFGLLLLAICLGFTWKERTKVA